MFFPKKLTVLHKNWSWEKHSLLYPKVLHDLILSLYLKIYSFRIKWYFLPKRNNAIKIWHFSKTENTSLRKLNISTRNEHFWKEWPFARKMKISFNIGVSARFPLIHVKHRLRKNWNKTNCHFFFFKLTTKLLLIPIVIFPEMDS